MILEDYVSFEVAKLLKEKGFDTFKPYGWDEELFDKEHPRNFSISFDNKEHWISCPTHQMAMKWLREVYHIEIYITFGFPFIDGKQQYKYFWSIVRVCNNHLEFPMDDPGSASYNEEMADSYEDAVEAALKYVIENLI